MDKQIKESLIERIDNGEIKTYFQLKMFLDLNGLELDKSILYLFCYDYFKQSYNLFINIITSHPDIDDYFKDNKLIRRIIFIHGIYVDYDSPEKFNMNKIFVPLFKRRPGILIKYYLKYFENDRTYLNDMKINTSNFLFFEGLLLTLLQNARNINSDYQKYLVMVEKKRDEIYKNIAYLK